MALPLLPTLALAAAPVAPAPISVPFTQLDTGHILIPVTIDGISTPFILDTGASVSVVLPAVWEATGHDPDHGLKIAGQGAGGAVSGVRVVHVPTITIGGATVDVGYMVEMAVAAEAPAPGQAAAFGGILGDDLLRNYVTELDFDTHVARFYGAGTTPPVPKSSVTTRRLRGGLMGIDLTISGKMLPGVLDLGAAATILNADALALVGATRQPDCGRKAVGADEHALQLDCVAPLSVSLGPHTFGDVALNVADLPIWATLRMKGPAAILGVDLLGHGTILVDPRHHVVGWE